MRAQPVSKDWLRFEINGHNEHIKQAIKRKGQCVTGVRSEIRICNREKILTVLEFSPSLLYAVWWW